MPFTFLDKQFIKFSISEQPSRPGKPEPVDVTDDSVTLFWKAPEDDGNSEIIEYYLEYQETTTTK